MKNHFPIYNLFHQEIRTCADHLLKMSRSKKLNVEKDAQHILGRMRDLQEFALKVRAVEAYFPLNELRHYMESTILSYEDEENKPQSMRLSEVVSLLGVPNPPDMQFQPLIVSSLICDFMRHFTSEVKPGRPLFKNLSTLKKLFAKV